MVSLSRRKLLQLAAFGVASRMMPLGALNAFAQSTGDYRALVCVFLFGGNDADNMVVPIDGQARMDYESVRASLLLDAASLLPIGSVNHATYGTTTYGLHPGMTHLHAIASKLAVVANVGTLVKPLTKDEYRLKLQPVPQALFSHADQQRQLQTASPIVPSGTGWGGRLADRLQGLNAPSTFPTGVSVSGTSVLLAGAMSQPVTLTTGSPLQLSGSSGTLGAARNGGLQQLLNFDTGFSMIQQASLTLSQGMQTGNVLTNALTRAAPLSTAFPTTSLGRQLEQIAKVIQVRAALGMKRQIFFCSTGGFDTHSDQLTQHAGLLAGVSEAMAAFYRATEELGVDRQVTTFTKSDFARTFQPNPTFGTDHAWGANHLVLGGAVNSGLYGEFPTLQLDGPDTTDSRGRWIPSTGMDQYGATLASWFGLSSGDLNLVFPNLRNFPIANLGFV